MIIEQVVYLLVALIIFRVVNYVGKLSYDQGYVTISLFVSDDDSVAFNFLYRILAPLILMALFVALHELLNIRYSAGGVLCLAAYYVGIRFCAVFLYGRESLIDWTKMLIQMALVLGSAACLNWVVSSKGISILPSPQEIVNELWLVAVLFVYTVINKIRLGSSTELRIEKYIRSRMVDFKSKYDEVIREITDKKDLVSLIYAVMLVENFNRSRNIRLIERLYARFSRRPVSQGVMQVQAAGIISDLESVKRGSNRLKIIYENAVAQAKSDEDNGDDYTFFYLRTELLQYNNSESYVSEVLELAEKLMNDGYIKSTKAP